MESRTTSDRTKINKRNSRFKVWEGLHIKPSLFTLAVFSFIVLMIAKIMINGAYLHLDKLPIRTVNLALAEEDIMEDDPEDLEELRIMLKKKEAELKAMEEDLKRQEKALLPLKNEIDAKIEELNELQSSLTAYAKNLAEREMALKDSKITHLVALYSSMDAGKAANIMDKLNNDTIVRILANMKGKSAGQILAMMPPEKGALISERLSRME